LLDELFLIKKRFISVEKGFAGRLLISLQHQMYRAQQGIDDSCNELLSMSSSISHDVANIRTHSGYLNKDLSDLHSHLGDTCGTANESIEKIRATEVVKQRMELTYRSLENQDNWEALLVNIKEFMANGDLEAISGRLSALQKCFVSLGDSAEHEQRRVQLDDVKNSVESFLIPRLVSGLSAASPWKNSSSSMRHPAGSEGLALKIVHIFNLMERTETLKRILRDCRQRQFIARWEELLKTSQVNNFSRKSIHCVVWEQNSGFASYGYLGKNLARFLHPADPYCRLLMLTLLPWPELNLKFRLRRTTLAVSLWRNP
jgi:hypothetical protein